MKKITSITMHTTSEGQRISYTFSEIDESSGTILSDNNRVSFVILDIEANRLALSAIKTIEDFIYEKMNV